MEQYNKYLVRVSCMTFNHAAYIVDAMNGFVMQQTTFPFVCTIVDDASTDGEQEVISKYVQEHFDLQGSTVACEKDTNYGHVTFVQHKTNKNCYFAVIYLQENHFNQKKSKAPYLAEWNDTKYVAICEGDDYWTDSLKLQKQVDFMEAHKDYSMCFHGARLINECGSIVTSNFHTLREGDYGPNDIFPIWVVPTASVIYRNEMVNNYPIRHADWFVFGDIVQFEKCAHVGKLFGINKEMSVYRMNSNSVLQNPKYQMDRLMRMPLHYKAMKMNFPKLDKKTLNGLIADAYYAKMRNENSLLMRIVVFFCFLMASPGYSIKKLYKKTRERL